MGKIIEGFWNCKHCGTKGIRGSIRECPNCAKARDKDTVFEFDKTKISYVPKEKAAQISRKPDWVCRYCEQLNSDNDKICVSCAAPRTEENLDYFENRKEKEEQRKKQEEKEVLDTSISESVFYPHYSSSDFTDDTSTFSNETSNKKSFSIKNFFSSHMLLIFITLFSIIGITGLIFLLIPKEQEITINQMEWQRSIEIERYQTVEESGSYLPPGAHLLDTEEVFSHNEDVIDHYEERTRTITEETVVGTTDVVVGYKDLGNGYFEEITNTTNVYGTYETEETYDEPIYTEVAVYETIYYYEIDKWLYERSVETSGTDKEPYWGEYDLASDERVAYENEHYSITGINQENEVKTIFLSYEDWNSLEVNETVKLKVSLGYGQIVE